MRRATPEGIHIETGTLAGLEPIEHLRLGFKDLPSGQVGEDIHDVAPQNPDIEVFMGAGLIPEEQIECPPAGNPWKTPTSGLKSVEGFTASQHRNN